MLTLLDNTVLSNFAIVKCPDLIQKALGETAATVQQVMDEFAAGVQRGRLPQVDWSWLPVLTLSSQEQQQYEALCQRLNRGEAACLAVAVNRKAHIFTDDRDARELAARMQVAVSGTLGVFVQLIDLKVIDLSQADEMLKIMIAAGYHSPITSLAQVL